MSSILKVDTIQTTSGATPTITDLGIANAAGAVLQVVHGTLPTTVSSTGASGSDYLVNIGLSATITPKASNSKILIDVSMYIGSDQSNSGGYLQSYLIYKAGSIFNDVHGTSEGGRRRVAGSINMYDTGGTYTTYRMGMLSGTHMDTNVGTTSATTFKVRAGMEAAGTFVFNGGNGTGRKFGGVCASSITVTEILQ